MNYKMLSKKVESYNEIFNKNYNNFIETIINMCQLIQNADGVNHITIFCNNFSFKFNQSEVEIITSEKSDRIIVIDKYTNFKYIYSDEITIFIKNWDIYKEDFEKNFEEEFLNRIEYF